MSTREASTRRPIEIPRTTLIALGILLFRFEIIMTQNLQQREPTTTFKTKIKPVPNQRPRP